MNLKEALISAKEGNFVTNEYFSSDQSLHYFNGKFYYEDGAVVTREFLEKQNFATSSKWSIIIPKEKVDFEKLKDMHVSSNGYMLSNCSYMECVIN